MSDPRSIALPSLLVGPPPGLLLIRSLSNYLAQPFDNRDLGRLRPRSLLDEQPIRATLHYGNIQTRRALRQGLDQPGPDRREPATALAGGRRTAWGDGSWRSTDEGVSGARWRDKRPGLDALLKGGIARREFDVVAAWSGCRLGRSLSDLVGLLVTCDWITMQPRF